MNELLEMLQSFNLVEVICIVILTIMAIKSLCVDLKKIKKEHNSELEAYHNTMTKTENATTTIENRIKTLEENDELKKKKIDKMNDTLSIIEKSINDVRDDFLHHRIECMRNKILDFMPQAIDMSIYQSKEKYLEIARIHDEYIKIMEENGLENGFETFNYQMIQKSYQERTEKKMFTEDKYNHGGNKNE